MNEENFKSILEPTAEEISSVSVNSSRESFFSTRGVKQCKNALLHERLQTLIYRAGLTNSEFYKVVGISRQYYYFISWGLWECPIDLKIKIAKELGTDSSLIWQNRKLNSESDSNAS